MPGIADLLYGLAGQPSPEQQIARMLTGQTSPAGGPAPQQGPPPQPQPGGGGPPLTPGTLPPQVAQQTPQSLQSTPDMSSAYGAIANPPNLMSLYLQLDQRARASDQINRGLALIAANHSSPRMARAIFESMSPQPDAGQQLGNLMQLYGAQQQFAAQREMLGSAADIAAKTGLPESMVRAEIMAGRGGELMRPMMPPEHAREYEWFAQKYAGEHAGDVDPVTGQPLGPEGARKQFEDQYPPGLAMGAMAGMQDPVMRSMTIANIAWNRDPANSSKVKPAYLTDPEKFRVHTEELNNATREFSGLNQRLGNYVDALGGVASDPNLGKVVGGGLVGQVAAKGLAAFPGTDEYKLAFDISGLPGLSKQVAAAPGTRPGDFATIGANLEDFSKTGLSVNQYRESVIAPRMRAALAAQANAYAAAGRYNAMPGYLKLFVDPIYAPGGELDMGGSAPKRPPMPGKEQPTQQDIEEIRKDIEVRGPRAALERARSQNIDTSSLE